MSMYNGITIVVVRSVTYSMIICSKYSVSCIAYI